MCFWFFFEKNSIKNNKNTKFPTDTSGSNSLPKYTS
jgi:hypothetical protein